MAAPLAAALGPVGGLAACACCLLLTAIWGLFATMIALAVYTKRWADAINSAFNVNGSGQMIMSQILLLGILCVYGYVGLRRALRSAS